METCFCPVTRKSLPSECRPELLTYLLHAARQSSVFRLSHVVAITADTHDIL